MTIFEKLLICHLVGDWILQNQWMADRKTKIAWVRAIHCAIYTACFFWLGPLWASYIFVTHFVIDTYKPLYWFRKARGDYQNIDDFRDSFKTPSGFFVNVVFDQIFHILTFIPIVLMEVNK